MALTQLQEEAFRRYKTLRPVKLDINDISRKFYNPCYINNKNEIICHTCGHNIGNYHQYAKFKTKKDEFWQSDAKPKPGAKCPHCGKKISLICNHWFNSWIGYYVQYQRCRNWQIQRYHLIQLFPHRNEKATFKIIQDNYQIWYHESGYRVTIGHATSFMPKRKYNPLSQWDEPHVRQDNESDYVNYEIDCHQIISLAPWFRHVIQSYAKGQKIYDNHNRIERIMKNVYKVHLHPYFETLLKQNKLDLIDSMSYQDMRLYHRQIRIAVFRNHYDIQNWHDYKDMLVLMKEFNFDTHSPKYLCPTDFKQWHDHLVELKRRKDELLRKEREAKRAKENLEKYQSEKKKFFCIYIPTDKWFIRPIFSPEEMIEEGKHMHHCVGGYWNRKDSLILVCRSFKDERIATIEINIQSKEIIQIRGLQNAKPKYYNQIHKVLNSRMADILHPTKKKFVKPLPLAA